MIPASAANDVQEAFRDIYRQLETLLGAKNIDLKGRRIINAGPASETMDYVTRADLSAVVKAPPLGVTSITGTADQVTASPAAGAVVLTLPQSIATTSTPQLARLGLGAAADSAALLNLNGTLVHGTSTGMGVGTTAPKTKADVRGAPDANYGTAVFFDPTTAGANVGAVLAVAGYKTGTASEAIFAKIKGLKENSTAGNEAGYLAFEVNNGSAYVEGLRINSGKGLDAVAGFTKYQNVTAVGWGVPAIYAAGRSTAQTAAVASVATYTVGAADGSFEVSANVLVTTSTLHNFTATCAYTDEGNTARTLTLTFSQITGAFVTAITNVTGAGPYEGVPLHIRCKASTAITIATTGTFTTIAYNCEGIIRQLA